VVCGDLSIPATLATAFDGIDTAFYLVHALGTKHRDPVPAPAEPPRRGPHPPRVG
jgi:uncharacterized protein YbjT (DUF2867 family)